MQYSSQGANAHFHVIFSLDRSPLRVKKKFALNKIYTSNIHIYWPRRSALNYPYVKILVSLGLVRSGWCVGWCAGWCAGRCAGCSRQFCGARDGAEGGRSAGSSKTPFCLAYIRARAEGRIRFPRVPGVPRGSPRFPPRIPAVPRGSPRIPADPRGSSRIPADPRGSPRIPAVPRRSPRFPAVPRGSLRFSADSQPIL